MYIEPKYNYKNTHDGYLWAEEIDAVAEEIVNAFKWFTPASKQDKTQLIKGIVQLLASKWRGSNYYNGTEEVFALYRQQGIPPFEVTEGVGGTLFITQSNNAKNPKIMLVGKPNELYSSKIRNDDIPANGLKDGEFYKFIVLKDSDNKLYFNFVPISVKTDINVNSDSGKLITTEKLEIVDGRINLPRIPNGDIVMNLAHVFKKENDVISNDYDVVDCKIDPDDNSKAIIYTSGEVFLEPNHYAMVSFVC